MENRSVPHFHGLQHRTELKTQTDRFHSFILEFINKFYLQIEQCSYSLCFKKHFTLSPLLELHFEKQCDPKQNARITFDFEEILFN